MPETAGTEKNSHDLPFRTAAVSDNVPPVQPIRSAEACRVAVGASARRTEAEAGAGNGEERCEKERNGQESSLQGASTRG